MLFDVLLFSDTPTFLFSYEFAEMNSSFVYIVNPTIMKYRHYYICKRTSSSCFKCLDFFKRFTAGTFPEVILERIDRCVQNTEITIVAM